MLNTSSTAPGVQQGPALLRDIDALVSGWDTSRPAADLIAVLKEKVEHASIVPATVQAEQKRKRGKSMSRRKGQLGYIEKHGKYYTVRVWMDVEGQEERVHQRIRICPINPKSPGWLNASERQNKAKEILGTIGANSPERFNKVVKSASSVRGRTFAEQAEIYLEELRERDDPTASSTQESWGGCIRNWLNPMIGDLPLEDVGNGALKRVVAWMKKGGECPSERKNNEAL